MGGGFSTVGGGASASDIWNYPTRTLTQSKFPFWSAIITQQAGSISVASDAIGVVDIQPPSGETWWISILAGWSSTVQGNAGKANIYYSDFDGTTERTHGTMLGGPSYNVVPSLFVERLLTNTLYGRISFHNGLAALHSAYYGYSGFKLSKPLWSPSRVSNSAKPFKLKTNLPLPDPIKPLDKYKCLIYGINPNKPDDYDLAIVLEEDTPLAIDPNTGFPVERYSVYVLASALADLIAKFKTGALDPVKAGYRKYLDRWKGEGIDFGI